MNTTGAWIESTIGLPAKQPHAWETVPYQIGGHEIVLARPRDPDRLLDDPAVQRASQQTDYMPYWAYLWPGAVLLAECVVAESWQPGTVAIEIGCGLGLAGLAALRAGLHVTFSDYSPAALALAAHNARLNGFDRFTTRLLDWQQPPRDRYDVILGADVLYETRCLPDVVRVLESMLAPAGIALLADPDRAVADSFVAMACACGFLVTSEQSSCVVDASGVVRGRIFRVSRADTVSSTQ